MSKMTITAVVSIAIAALGVGAHIMGARIARLRAMLPSTTRVAPTPEPVLSMTADQLCDRYAADPKGTEKALMGRIIRVTGRQGLNAYHDDEGVRDLMLGGLTDDAFVYCRLPQRTLLALSSKNNDKPLTVTGRFTVTDHFTNGHVYVDVIGGYVPCVDGDTTSLGNPTQ